MSAVVASLLAIVFGALLFAIVLIVAIVDCRRQVIPDRLNFLLGAGGVGQTLLLGHPAFTDAVAGAMVGLLMLYSVAVLFRRARGMDGLGFGDKKFAAAAGLWLGWQHIAPMLLIASVAALAFVALRSARTGVFDRSQRLPFSPFLGLGTIACWLGTIAIPAGA